MNHKTSGAVSVWAPNTYHLAVVERLLAQPSPIQASDRLQSWADLRNTAARQPTAGKVVAELKFAFWEKMFTAGQDSRIWLSHFRTSFPGAPSGLAIPAARAVAHNDLKAIRLLRNRIAHHEPIFNRNIADEYRRMREMIAWRSPVAATWMDRKQGVAVLVPLKP